MCSYNSCYFFIVTTSLLFMCINCVVDDVISCKENEDCDTEGAVCVKASCICPIGFLFNSERTKCIPEAFGYGSVCEDNVQCSAVLKPGGQCHNRICICAQNFHYLLGRCYKSAGLGEECRDNNHCFSDHDFQSTVCGNDHRCRCSDGYYQREYSSCRKMSTGPGQPCAISQDCHFQNATCTMSRICDYLNTTLQIPWPGNIHERKFPVNDTEKDGKATVGSKCSGSGDCSAIANSYCSSGGRCLCSAGFYHSEDMHACHSEIGANCKSDFDCKGRYTLCHNNSTCSCRPGFVARPDNQICLKQARNIGWSCLHDIQCSLMGEGSICVNKKCRCKPGTHLEESHLYCWRTLEFGQLCKSQEDCRGDGRLCTQNKCSCAEGYHPAMNNTACKKNAYVTGGNCSENSDCIFAHSVCSDGLCGCAPGFFSGESSTCFTGIGGECSSNSDCFATSSVCSNGKCACTDGYISNREGSRCVQVANAYGSPCEEHEQCKRVFGSLSECDVNRKCTCQRIAHFFKDKRDTDVGYCYKNVYLNQNCTKDAQCLDSSNTEQRTVECRRGFCKCRFEYEYNENYRMCSGGSRLQSIYPQLIFMLMVIFL